MEIVGCAASAISLDTVGFFLNVMGITKTVMDRRRSILWDKSSAVTQRTEGFGVDVVWTFV